MIKKSNKLKQANCDRVSIQRATLYAMNSDITKTITPMGWLQMIPVSLNGMVSAPSLPMPVYAK